MRVEPAQLISRGFHVSVVLLVLPYGFLAQGPLEGNEVGVVEEEARWRVEPELPLQSQGEKCVGRLRYRDLENGSLSPVQKKKPVPDHIGRETRLVTLTKSGDRFIENGLVGVGAELTV